MIVLIFKAALLLAFVMGIITSANSAAPSTSPTNVVHFRYLGECRMICYISFTSEFILSNLHPQAATEITLMLEP